jgi:hypothetical protein
MSLASTEQRVFSWLCFNLHQTFIPMPERGQVTRPSRHHRQRVGTRPCDGPNSGGGLTKNIIEAAEGKA